MSAIRELFTAASNLFKWWVVIAPWEQALRVRGGKRARLLSPGVHFRIPFWDRVYVQPVRLRVCTAGAQTLETANHRVLILQLLVSFRVNDLLTLYENLHRPDDTLKGFAMEAASEYVQSNEDVSPQALSSYVTDALRARVSGFGLADVEVGVTDFVYTPKAYRFVTGGIDTEVYGGYVSMGHDRENE